MEVFIAHPNHPPSPPPPPPPPLSSLSKPFTLSSTWIISSPFWTKATLTGSYRISVVNTHPSISPTLRPRMTTSSSFLTRKSQKEQKVTSPLASIGSSYTLDSTQLVKQDIVNCLYDLVKRLTTTPVVICILKDKKH